MPDASLFTHHALLRETADLPLIAVIVPLFKHTELVTEAILSALAQRGPIQVRVVIVNDGCPFLASERLGQSFAQAWPGQIVSIRRKNGGLSAARNTGIAYALAVWPELKAIYFLDADNRLYPDFLAKAWSVLEADKQAGWVYPDIDMFGEANNYDVAGNYSLLQHLLENTCEAGSLVRRALFDAGIRFDESMRLGFEDWDFWLQAAGAGFRGVHGANLGFRYRKRRESMLRNSERDRMEIIGYMRRKHKRLYSPAQLLRTEHAEAPRYAIVLADRQIVALTSDPHRLETTMSWEQFRANLRLSRLDGRRYFCPSFIIFTHPTFLTYLGRLKLERWVLWRLEDALQTANLAVATALNDGQDQSLQFRCGPSEARLGFHQHAGMVMVSTALLATCLDDPDPSWTLSLGSAQPQPNLFELKIDAAIAPQLGEIWTGAVPHFTAGFAELHHWWRHQPEERGFSWRDAVVTPKPKLPLALRDILGIAPLAPMVPRPGSRHIGFILPVAQFGGVEKVARAVAAFLGDNGWTPHLFIFNSKSVGDLDELAAVFETINFLDDDAVGHWERDGRYFGTGFTSWASHGNHARGLGLLAAMQAVVNCQSTDAHGLMGELRRLGIISLAHLHLIDASRHGQPVGFVYQSLGYEHCYDQFLVISDRLRATCLALGVPGEKLMLIPNAPSYPLSPDEIGQTLAEREPSTGRKLRCLYLGRFDRQKGLYRLANLVSIAREARLELEWRIVGGQILTQDGAEAELAQITDLVEPPMREAWRLTELYRWADILVLPSHFEGVPLTILEAMRLGVVVLATDVGAVAEVVDPDKTGFLFKNGDDRVLLREMLACLQKLRAQPKRLEALSQAAAEKAKTWQWSSACQPLLQFLDTKCPVPQTHTGLSQIGMKGSV